MKRSRSLSAASRYTPKSSLFVCLTVVAVASLPVGSSMTASSHPSDRRDEKERLMQRGSTVHVLRPDYSLPITYTTQIRPIPSSSLADRLNELFSQNGSDISNTDFVDRLRSEELASGVEKPKNPNNFLLASIGVSVTILFVSNWLSSHGFGSVSLMAVASDLYNTASSSLGVMWLPFLWIPLSSWKWSDFTCYVEMLVRPELFAYVRDQVLPYTGALLRKMIVNEIWRQFWSVFFKQVSAMFNPPTSGNDELGTKWKVPMWLSKFQLFLYTAVERGTQRTFRSMLQPHLQESIATVLRAIGSVLRQQYQTALAM